MRCSEGAFGGTLGPLSTSDHSPSSEARAEPGNLAAAGRLGPVLPCPGPGVAGMSCKDSDREAVKKTGQEGPCFLALVLGPGEAWVFRPQEGLECGVRRKL